MRGIPAQLRALTERVESVETSQETCQRIIDTDILPVLKELERRLRELSEKVESMRRVPK